MGGDNLHSDLSTWGRWCQEGKTVMRCPKDSYAHADAHTPHSNIDTYPTHTSTHPFTHMPSMFTLTRAHTHTHTHIYTHTLTFSQKEEFKGIAGQK